jgi:hypothetical protein
MCSRVRRTFPTPAPSSVTPHIVHRHGSRAARPGPDAVRVVQRGLRRAQSIVSSVRHTCVTWVTRRFEWVFNVCQETHWHDANCPAGASVCERITSEFAGELTDYRHAAGHQ